MWLQKSFITISSALLISGFISCNKVKLNPGTFIFTADNLEPKTVILLNSSQSLLEFEYAGLKNYISIDDKGKATGIWVFDELVDGTTSKLGYNLIGQLEKSNKQWIITGSITFKQYNVDVIGEFSLSPI